MIPTGLPDSGYFDIGSIVAAQLSGIYLSRNSVFSTAANNSVVGDFIVIGAEDSELSFAFITGQGADNNDDFTISADQLVCRSPSALGAGIYYIRVQATDSNGATVTQPLSVVIRDASASVGLTISRPPNTSVVRRIAHSAVR